MFLIALGFAFLIIGICLLIMAPVQAAQNKRRSAETEGYVTEVRKHYRNKGGTTYRIDFEFTVDGERQELKNVSWPIAPEQSKTYTVLYNPEKPKDAHIKEFRSGNPKVYLIIGAIATVAAFVLVVVGAVVGV